MNAIKISLLCVTSIVFFNAYGMEEGDSQKELSWQLKALQLKEAEVLCSAEFPRRKKKIRTLAFNPRGTKLGVNYGDRVDILDLKTQQVENSLFNLGYDECSDVAFNRDDQFFATAGVPTKIWKKQDEGYVDKGGISFDTKMDSKIAFSAQNKLAEIGGNYLEIVSIQENGRLGRRYIIDLYPEDKKYQIWAALAFNSPGDRIAAGNVLSVIRKLEIWDPEGKTRILEREDVAEGLKNYGKFSLVFRSDSQILASTRGKKGIDILDPRSNQLIHLLEIEHKDDILALHLSQDDKSLLSASSDGTVKVWDMRMCNQQVKQ